MPNDFILRESKNGVGKITLNRPDVLNSFNREMAVSMQDALDEFSKDAQVRAVLLTGNGRAFSAGQDLSEVPPDSDSPGKIVSEIVKRSYNPIIRRICQIEKPVVCALNGTAAGAGANMALASDLVLAAKSASFIQSFCHIGLIPDSGGTFFLPRLVGIPLAKAMMLLGEKISAERAFEIGLVYRLVDDDDLMTEAENLAQHLASMPTKGLGLIKRAISKSFTNDLDSQLELEMELQEIAASSHDFREGVEAFLQKRKPGFKGR